MAYGFNFDIGGGAVKQFQTMLGNLGQLQTGAKAAQVAFDKLRVPSQSSVAAKGGVASPFLPTVKAAQTAIKPPQTGGDAGKVLPSLRPPIDEATGAMARFQDSLRKTGSTGDSVFGGLKNQIAGVFAVGSLVGFGRSVVDTLSEFQKYDAVLTNTLGSNKAAQQVMAQITDFAAKTPFQVGELTGAFVKLANQGFAPNMEQMTKLGNLASSTGKGFDQLAEAVLDAQMGEFERLKEFGIKAKADKGSDNILVTFKNQTKAIGNTSKAMQDYLLSLGNMKGVAGAMDAISQTVGGKISNMQDQFTAFKLSVGEAFAPLISNIVGGMTTAFTSLSAWVKQNKEWIVAWTQEIIRLGEAVLIGYGVFKTLSFAVSAYQTVMLIATNASWLFAGVQGTINALMMANLIGLVIAAFAALTTGVIYAWNKFEGFRGFIYGFWEVVKLFGKFIYDFAIAPLVALGEILIGTFTFDTALIQKGMNDALETVKNNVDNMMNVGVKIGQAFNSGFNKGVADFQSSMPKAENKTASVGNIGAATPKNLGIDKKGKEIAGENRQVKNITITIGSLISGGFTVVSENLQESEQKIKEIITRVLVDATNQVNYQ